MSSKVNPLLSTHSKSRYFECGEHSVLNLVKNLSVKMNFFVEQDENAMNSEGAFSRNNVLNCSEEERKMMWMRETRIRTFMQIELEACRNELEWTARTHDCILNNFPEENFPPVMPLPIPLVMSFI